MATLCLSVPTTNDTDTITGGACYLILSKPTITVRDLIIEKIRSEYRKLRAGGPSVTSLDALCGVLPATIDEAIELAIGGFNIRYLIEEDGVPVLIDQDIVITSNTQIAFELLAAEPTLGRIELDAMRKACGIEVKPLGKKWQVVNPTPSICIFKYRVNAESVADDLAMELVNAGFVGDLDAIGAAVEAL